MSRTAKIGVTMGTSVVVSALCLLLAWLPGRLFGLTGVSFLVAKMLFPFWTLGFCLHAGQGAAAFPSSFWFVLLEFPLYGIFVCQAWLRNKLREIGRAHV